MNIDVDLEIFVNMFFIIAYIFALSDVLGLCVLDL